MNSPTNSPTNSTTSTSIRLRNLHKSFRDGRDQILKGVNIDFPPGELTYILGPSGTGKSVLIKHILGLLRPDSGEIWVNDQELSQLSHEQLFEHRTQFGMLFQNSALFDDMTIFENVAFPLYEHTRFTHAEVRTKVEHSLSLLGMPGGFDKYPSEISGGMKKRVALARAIIREPKALLYDEPTTGLDPVTRTTVDDLIETLKTKLKVTSIVISHDIPSALLLADRIGFLFDGQFVFLGTPEEFRSAQHPAIQKFMVAEKRTLHALQGLEA